MRFDHAAFLLASVLGLYTANPLHAETSSPCRTESQQNHSFIVCEFDLRRYDLKLLWKKPDGEASGSLSNIPHSNNGSLVSATNGGMYRPDRSPVGLDIAHGRALLGAVRSSGIRHFYLMPH